MTDASWAEITPTITSAKVNVTMPKYEVKFMNGDETVDTQQVELDSFATAPEAPSKADSANGQYSYKFAGWATSVDGEPVNVAANAITGITTYYAIYTPVVKTYSVSFKADEASEPFFTVADVEWGTDVSAVEGLVDAITEAAIPEYNEEDQPLLGWTNTVTNTRLEGEGNTFTGKVTGNIVAVPAYQQYPSVTYIIDDLA